MFISFIAQALYEDNILKILFWILSKTIELTMPQA